MPSNVVAKAFPEPPANPGAPSVVDSPGYTTNYDGLDDNNTLSPPDVNGTVGLNHVVTMLNTEVKITSRDGGTTYYQNSLFNWWSAGLSGFSLVFDPRILYDPFKDRWIAVAATDPVAVSSAVLVAVSATGDPTGSWYYHKYVADSMGLYWADYPNVGFNKDAIVVTWNYLDVATTTNNSTGIAVFDKSGMYAGQANPTYDYRILNALTYGSSHIPAISYDTNTTTIYLMNDIRDNSGGNSYLSVYTITGAFGSHTVAQLPFTPSGPAWATFISTDAGPQKGSSVKIDLGDDRLSQVIYKLGFLWCAQTIYLPAGAPTRSAVQWWQVNPAGSGSVVQRGVLGDSTGKTNYAFPSIGVNRFKDVLVGYSYFSTNNYASAAYSFHACNDQLSSLESQVVFKAGIAPYYRQVRGVNRWGDFSSTWADPLNDTDFWTIQEYAMTNVGSINTNGSGRWGTWWSFVPMVLPANDNFTNFYSLSGNQATTNGTLLRATRETGEPNHAGNTNTPSVWYRWTAPANGNVTFDATNSVGFTLVLAAYTGTNVSGLTLKTNATGVAPKIVFNAISNTTYQIAVAGLNGACGDFTLHFAQPTPPMFVAQPVSTNVVANAGENAILNSMAIGSPDPTFQWKFFGTNASPTTNAISGATNASYTITNVQGTNAGNYFVIATNSSGSATSMVATVFVHGDSAARQGPISFTNNQFWFQIWGLTNRAYRIETSTNLVNWSSIYTNNVSYWYTNSSTSNDPQRFYRSITNN